MGLEPGLRWGISDDHLKDKNISEHDLRITYLWRARNALAVLQWTEVPGGTAFALGHRGKFSVRAELGTLASDIYCGKIRGLSLVKLEEKRMGGGPLLAPARAQGRAHNLCHDNRQLIVLAINCHSASKNNCN